MAQKLILIDGNSLLYRAFYALPLTISTSNGVITNAVYGFTSMLIKLLKNEKPDYIAVAFDKGIVTFRHEIYEDYKATRDETPDELIHQFGLVKDVLDSLDISIYETEGFEADDILATIAKNSSEKGAEVKVVTGDKDAFQLINDKVKVITTRKGISDIVTYDIDKVIERYNLPPEKILDMVGLKGDPSDNIPGVPGIGEKTASKLIQEFGSLEELMNQKDKVKGPKLNQSLHEYEEQAKTSKELATLRYDVPLDFSLKKCVFSIDIDKASQLFREMEFKTLLVRLNELIASGKEDKQEEITQIEYITVKKKDIVKITNEIEKEKDIALESLDDGTMITVASKNYLLPTSLINEIKKTFQNKEIKKNSFDLKKVIVNLNYQGIELRGGYFDISIAAYLLQPGKAIDSSELAIKYLDEYIVVSKDQFIDAAQKTSITLKLRGILGKRLKEEKVEKVYKDIEFPLLGVLAQMESSGIRLDEKILKEYSQQLQSMLDKLDESIYKHAAAEFNINSPQQLSEILFNKLKLKPIKKTKTGFSTDSTVLARLINDHPIIEDIINFRELDKLKSTYIDALPQLINEKDEKLHTSFNQAVTATGRLSSSNPNLQNIPIRTDIGSQTRKAFIPSKGNVLLVSDYDQIELRILAYLSGDEKLIEAFENEEDIHTSTAKDVFSLKEVDQNARRAAKAVNFGIVYGISSRGLAEQLNITQIEAQTYINKYFDKYTKVDQFLNKIIENATNKGFVETMFGRKRWLPELKNPNVRIRNFGKRTAVNTVMQGSAADIIKKAMIVLNDKLAEEQLKSKMIIQVHDELILDVPKDEKDDVKDIVRIAMEETVDIKPDLKTNIAFGNNWLEAKH